MKSSISVARSLHVPSSTIMAKQNFSDSVEDPDVEEIRCCTAS